MITSWCTTDGQERRCASCHELQAWIITFYPVLVTPRNAGRRVLVLRKLYSDTQITREVEKKEREEERSVVSDDDKLRLEPVSLSS